MKKIGRLKINALSTIFVPLTDEERAEIMGGWYCFSYCMNYIGAGGDRFQHYYDNLYGSAESGGGVSNSYVEGPLNYAGINYNNYDGASLSSIRPNGRQIISINGNTHAVIYVGAFRNDNGMIVASYLDPQTGMNGQYTFEKNEQISIIGF